MTKKKPSKSSVAMFGDAINAFTNDDSAEGDNFSPKTETKRVSSGVVSAARESALVDLREERDRLKAELENAQDIKTLDPKLIDPSPFPDRLEDQDSEADFEVLKQSIAEEGQQLPVFVRPHPTVSGRFQLAYGHRRLRAIKELGHEKILACIRDLNDNELIAAQGIENSARRDLSFIEKALFAEHIRNQCQNKRDEVAKVKSILSCTDADVSAFKHILSTLPSTVIRLIGPATKVGKPRWRQLAKQAQEHADSKILEGLEKDRVFSSINDTNQRFDYVLNLFSTKSTSAASSEFLEIGKTTISIARKAKTISLTSNNKAFGEWLINNLSNLHLAYEKDRK
jgi:ParB family chromosome partitioning protein